MDVPSAAHLHPVVKPAPCTPPMKQRQVNERYNDIVKTMKTKRAIEKRSRVNQYFQT